MHSFMKSYKQILLVASFFVSAVFTTTETTAQPCYSGYKYRVPIEIDNSKNDKLTSHEVQVFVNTYALISTGKMQSLGQDIRFKDKQGTELSFWIADGTINSSATEIWIRTDSVSSYAKDTVYLYYGNGSATTKSNSVSTFHLVDEFNGSTLNSFNWTSCGSGTIALSKGKLKLTSNSTEATIKSRLLFDAPVIVEMQGVQSFGGTALLGQQNSSGNGYGMMHNGSNMQLSTITNGTTCMSTTGYGSTNSTGVSGDWNFVWNNTDQLANWAGQTLSSTNSTYGIGSASGIILANFGSFGTLEIDYLRIRKYAKYTPSITIGKEVSMDYTPSISYNQPLCENEDLNLTVQKITGADYYWTGPNGFTSTSQNPTISKVSLADSGSYSVTVTIPTGCASKTASMTISILPKSEGGTATGAKTVCSGSNYGVVAVSGQAGNVQYWEHATQANGPWKQIANTGTTQSYSDLNTTTWYRAIVSNGSCSIDSSSAVKIEVIKSSVGGKVTGGTSVCTGTNSGTVTLTDYTGSILYWEVSNDGNNWSKTTDTTASVSYSNLSKATYYRAEVQNSFCASETSSSALIDVDELTVSGVLTGGADVCPEANQGTLNLYNHVGTVLRWESIKSGSSTWDSVAGSQTSYDFKDLTVTTNFRVIVKNGVCSDAESNDVAVSLYAKSKAGKITGAKEVCASGNSGKLEVTGEVGTIQKWQENSKGTWSDISSTSNVYAWNNLTDSTAYRVIVSNQSCQADTSAAVDVYVNPISVGGYVSGIDNVCIGLDTAVFEVNDYTGSVQKWQWSARGYGPWYDVANTQASSITLDNNSTTKFYRAEIKSGTCASVYSSAKDLVVDARSDAGKVVQNLELCEGVNFGVIKVTGVSGDIKNWLSATTSTGTWSEENITTTTYEIQNVSNNVYLKAVAKSGVCPADTSDIAIVEVAKKSNAGKIYGNKNWCADINEGKVEVKDLVGDVLYWELSETKGISWNKYVTDATEYNYKNLSKSTYFRAVVRNGVCDNATSDIVVVNIESASKSGELVADDVFVCDGDNYGNVKLIDFIGDVEDWQSLDTATNTWVSLQNQTNRQAYSNLKEQTTYRAIVSNNFCDADTTKPLTIYVSEKSVGGEISGVAEVCKSVGTTMVQLQNFEGVVLTWEVSAEENGPWLDLKINTTDLAIDNNGETQFYRAKVMNGVCPADYSKVFKHTVYEPTIPGKIIGGTAVCEMKNEGVLELVGYNGTVLEWEAKDGNGIWKPIGFTGDLYWFENLPQTTSFRALVQNGTCLVKHSDEAVVTTNPLPKVDFKFNTLCEEQDAQFTNNSTIPVGAINHFEWRFSDGYLSNQENMSRVFHSPGKLEVELSAGSVAGCTTSVKQEIVINEIPFPAFVIADGVTTTSACLNTKLTLENKTAFSNLGELQYQWDLGYGMVTISENPTVSFATSGDKQISLEATTRAGCVNKTDLRITILEEIKPKLEQNITASLGVPTELVAKGNVSYHWSPEDLLSDPNIANPIATITEPTTFVVEGTDYYGCKSKDSVFVDVIRDFRITPSNVVTPDGNNENDVWEISNIENYPNHNISVYDRWGREVFHTTNYQNDWGAINVNGKPLMDGTYYYVIELPEDGKVIKGAITVVLNK